MTLVVEYVNLNFTTVEDLGQLDSKVTELESLKTQVDDAVKNKLLNLNDAPEDEIDDSRTEAIGRLISGVRQTEGLTLEESIEAVDKLIAEYGEVKVLVDLKANYEDKLLLVTTVAFLERSRVIEEELTSGDADLKDIHESIDLLLEYNELVIYDQIISQLTTALNDKVLQKKQIYETSLRNKLTEVNWLAPKAKKHPSVQKQDIKIITKTFEDLIDLQSISNKPTYPETWWGLDILLLPIITRFNYHFASNNKETNKITRPEWALNFIEAFLADEATYVELVVSGILEKHTRLTIYEIITSILHPLREKIFNMIRIINDNITKSQDLEDSLEKVGRVLSHLIFELTSFDQRVRNQYQYNPFIEEFDTVPTKRWLGLTGDVLLHDKNEKVAVNNWLNFEYRLAKQRFDSEIVSSKNAFEIDFDYGSDRNDHSGGHGHILKPTYSAFNLVKLFNNLTNHYNTLFIVKYQLKYVSNVQLKFIDNYIEVVKKSLRAFNDSFNSKSVLNFIPGGLTEGGKASNFEVMNNGLKGLEILTGLFCLIRFVVDNLNEWSEELIFIQLWNTYKDISRSDDIEELSIFDSSLDQCQILTQQILNKYEDFFRKEIKESLKYYVNSSQWNITSTIGNVEPSSSLSPLISSLPVYMSFLRKCLSDLDYFIVSDKVVNTLSVIVHEYIVTNNRFTKHGVEQLKADFAYINTKLRDELLLYPLESDITNVTNFSYTKLQQSIDFLDKLDPIVAKSMKRDFSKITELRTEFGHQLSHLQDHEINDLLYRIV